jgi:hypothetical protein
MTSQSLSDERRELGQAHDILEQQQNGDIKRIFPGAHVKADRVGHREGLCLHALA